MAISQNTKKGTKVNLVKAYAKWELDHFTEIFGVNGGVNGSQLIEALPAILTYYSQPTIGKVVKKSPSDKDTFLVDFKLKSGYTVSTYIERKNLCLAASKKRLRSR